MNFNLALDKAAQLSKGVLPQLQEDVFLVRDLHGRIRVLLESGNPEDKPVKPFKDAFKKALKDLSRDLVANLGPYAYPKKDLFLFREDLPSLELPDAASATVLAEDGAYKVCLHDRLLTGTEWNAKPLAENKDPKRFTLFSMKGGVGRSTTASILAWHLAKKDKRVLVLDLDLESPGVGATLLGTSLPQYGLVDWFVEDALGQGDAVIPDMVEESPISDSTPGTIFVVPAFGADETDYLAKLGRAYLDRGPNGHEPWPDRLKRLVEKLEAEKRPDIVLLDSRTGLHDTSAALVLAMGANTLLFAVDSRQTWTAYKFLFQHWNHHPNVQDFRDKLWILGSMVPKKDTDDYIEGLRDAAWDLFLKWLYDEPTPAGQPEPEFTYSQADEVGNHYPRPILWDEGLTSFDPTSSLQEAAVQAAYTTFFEWFDRVLLNEVVTT